MNPLSVRRIHSFKDMGRKKNHFSNRLICSFIMTILLLSVATFIQFSTSSSLQQQIAYAQSTTCTNLAISSNAVRASGSQSTNPPSNVVDNNLATRWSNLGIGSWIQTDLGAQKTVCFVDIAWYLGNPRQYNFVISVSSDGTTFSNVLMTKSSGTTSSSERYNFADVNARYVRITVNGNTANDYAAITEIDVYGHDPTGTPPPPTPIPPPPTPIPPSNFNIAAVGDWGCNSNTDKTISNIQAKNPELILGLGDYSYQSTANCWLQKVDPIDEKMEITIGNHDDESSSLLNQYLSHFGLNSQYYSFNFQRIHFTVMSTELSLGVGSSQYNFVKSDLAQAASNPDIDWIIVFYHKLAYTSSTTHSASSTLRNAYHPLFDQYGVDLVLQGHNHNYQRTFPLMYNSASPSNPIKTSTNTNTYNDPTGQVYATVGTGGVSLYNLNSKASFVVTQSKVYGILNIDVINNGATLDATFYANDGTTKDHFSITK
jgi:predicted phosphodiesterase